MEFKRLNKRKEKNNKRGVLLVLMLFVILYLWLKMDNLIEIFFSK